MESRKSPLCKWRNKNCLIYDQLHKIFNKETATGEFIASIDNKHRINKSTNQQLNNYYTIEDNFSDINSIVDNNSDSDYSPTTNNCKSVTPTITPTNNTTNTIRNISVTDTNNNTDSRDIATNNIDTSFTTNIISTKTNSNIFKIIPTNNSKTQVRSHHYTTSKNKVLSNINELISCKKSKMETNTTTINNQCKRECVEYVCTNYSNEQNFTNYLSLFDDINICNTFSYITTDELKKRYLEDKLNNL